MAIPLIPAVDVCIHRDFTGVLLIHTASTFATDGLYRGCLPFGEEERFTVSEFERQAVPKIRESFRSFPMRKGAPDSEFGSFTKKKWLSILRDHRIVGVSLQESGLWHLGPYYHTRAGRYHPDDPLLWPPESDEHLFYRLLWMAIGRAELKKKKSNKAPEPTPRPVTIPAEPGIAPGRSVAHL